jgi:hypothetical protein
MANTNAIVEQLKELGLRHGEKAGVAIASMVFLVCVGMAATQKSIETTPDQVKKAAQLSESNITRNEKRETIIERLSEKGIKESDFAKVADEQVKTAIVADNYKAAREWVTPEPGAGLIRDTPNLIAVTELYAYPGRGGILVFELDENDERIPDPNAGKEATAENRRRRRRRQPAGMGGMSGMGGAPRKKRGKSQAEIARLDEEERKRAERQLQAKLTGGNTAEEAKEKDDKDSASDQPMKEVTKGYRWVAITGVLDHAKMVANYREALKNTAVAQPNYKRLDLQRQTLQPDGTWTKWESVSSDENLKVLDNLPEEDEELTPETVRPKSLVDPLPFLKAGLWEKVHIASLVPKERKEIPKNEMPGGMMGRMGGMGAMRGGYGAMAGGGGGMGGMRAGMGRSMGGMSAMAGMMMGGGGGMTGGNETLGDFWRSDAKNVMIRAFDFTAKEDTTYRYRVRIVVFNPNKGRDDIDVTKSVDNKADELRGPWSEATDEVTMPPDIMPYATATSPPSQTSDMKVRFQVVRFHPADGVTVPRTFDAAPGEVIGEPRTSDIPASDGTGKKSKVIDFNSRQIVIDVVSNKKTGGYQHLPAGLVGPPVARPALALLLRPDGSVALHNEADDETNEVRRDIDANYHHELDQSTKKRQTSMGMGSMGGMMGRMQGGGMGGGGTAR